MNTAKAKQMTAFRFARLHNVPVKYSKEYREDFFKRGLANIECRAAIGYYHHYSDAAIAINRNHHTSQIHKETNLWHELGHYLDIKQLGEDKYEAMSILYREARASAIAIKLMKKYGRWQEYKRKGLLWGYETYLSDPNQKNYRYLIEEA